MAKKKDFTKDLERSPATKFISVVNNDVVEEKEEITQPNGETIAVDQVKLNLDQQPQEQKKSLKKDPKEVRKKHFNLMITEPQYEMLNKIAIGYNISINELINRYIDDGIKNSKDALEKYEKLKELLGI